MHIGIDCRLAGRRHGGIGRYIENLITRLPSLSPDDSFTYFFYNQEQVDDIELPQADNLNLVFVPIKHYSLAEQLVLPRRITRQQLDLLHIPHFNKPLLYKGTLVLTIHDLLWHEQKGLTVTTLAPWLYWPKYLGYRFITANALQQAKAIIVPAETIKQTLTHYYPKLAHKVRVTKEGIDETFLAKNSSAKKPIISKKFIYVGSLYPHKNIQVVLKALQQLPQYQLVITGVRNVFMDRVKAQVMKMGVGNQVTFTGYLKDTALIEELKSAFALVQPSLSEGFGLTGVEAMACGTPVLASDIPIFKEIYRKAAIFFDPTSADSFVTAVNELAQSNRAEISQRGLIQAEKYSWDKMAKQTLNIYHQVIRP